MQITLANPFPARRHWGIVTVPSELAFDEEEATLQLEDGREFRAVRCKTQGVKTVYRIRASLDGNEMVTGTLVPRPSKQVEEFRPHPWVADDFRALVPRFAGSVEKVEESPCHARFVANGSSVDGLQKVLWADLYHDDPVVPVYGKYVWSNRVDPRPNVEIAGDDLWVMTGEYMALDFATRHGMPGPVRTGDGLWFHYLADQPIVLQDGSGLPFSGNMLCFIPQSWADAPTEEEEASVRDLQAGALGPILGVCHEWNGHFLANGWIPRLLGDWWKGVSDVEWLQFQNMLQQRAGWFAPRPLGLPPYAASVADQEDFGATKGTMAVTLGDPRWIYMARYSVQAELFRGCHLYEADGTPLDLNKHPNWVTQAGATHWSPGVSPDRLGKDPAFAPANGWWGYDDEHRSQNNLAAYLCLTDDPLMEDHVRHQTTVDEAAYRVRFPERGAGAARAQGRATHTLAQLASVMDKETATRLRVVMGRRMLTINQNDLLRVSGPMKVLAYGAPDDRKPIWDAEGNRAPWVSLWEHGLAMVGFAHWWRDKSYPDLLRTVARTLVTFGYFMEGDRWHTVGDILWSDGAAPPGGLRTGSPHLTSSPEARDVFSWTFNGLLVARDVLGSDAPSSLEEYILSVTGGREAADRRTAEWWAAVEKVVK